MPNKNHHAQKFSQQIGYERFGWKGVENFEIEYTSSGKS
jgi:hypothetical protein